MRFIIRNSPETVSKLLEAGFKIYSADTLNYQYLKVRFISKHLIGVYSFNSGIADAIIYPEQLPELMLLQTDRLRATYLGVTYHETEDT